ncbi:nicotinamide adenine dinucleotide transporter [Acrasis kona]|uniref:Nicotinamide adenine dinucleotide transporter n=1 Tax=Acrasis kona TaxID=1008807 RepID=A0AAW2YY68_9EUKA
MEAIEECVEEDRYMNRMCAALISGVVNSFVTQPIDTAKTRMQISGYNATSRAHSSANILPSSTRNRPFRAMTQIYKREGFLALYRGLPPSMLVSCISASTFFPIYEKVKFVCSSYLERDRNHPFCIIPGVMTAWFASSALVTPFSVIRVRLQTQEKFIGPVKTIRDIYKNEGLKGFYAGYRCMMINSLLTSVHFSLYEPLRLTMSDRTGLPRYVCAGISSAISMSVVFTVTYPIDLVISRLQYQSRDKEYSGMLDAMSKIAKREGIKGLYAGLTAYWARFIVGTITTMGTMEFVLDKM